MNSSGASSQLGEDGLPTGYRLRPDYEIAPRPAQQLIARGEALLLDCRTPEEHAVARIAGSLLIPLAELERRFEEVCEAIEDDPHRPVVVYCHHGMRSLRVATFLQAKGIAQARSLAGGIDLWSQAIEPSIPRY
jgi:rhodanese-related sulfurtransferase